MSIVSKSLLIAALMACGATVMSSDAQANNGKGKLNQGYGNSHSENSLKTKFQSQTIAHQK